MPASPSFLDFALCYGSLAVTIIGFVLFAAMTDADARRSYLRRLNPRPASESPQPPVTHAVDAETPSGVRVTILPPEKPAAAPASVVVAPSAPAALPPAPPVENSQPDA